MAILKKRTSSKKLPEARGLDRAPLDSIIRGINTSPSNFGGSSSLTSTGGGSSNLTTTAGGSRPSITTSTGSSKPTLTSTTGSKPAVTTTTSKTPTSITTSPLKVPKQTVKPNVSKPNSTTSKVVNALTGAAIGAGTKLLIDKISSKPSIAKTPAEKDREKKALDASVLRDKKLEQIKAEDKASAQRLAADKKASDLLAASNKKAAEDLAKANAAKINPTTGKPVGTGFGDDREEFTTDSLGNTYKTMPDGTSVLYRAAEVPDEEFSTDSLGNVYKTMPDGTSVLYRAAEAPADEFMTDSLGNIYKTMPDGSYELYRAAEVAEDEYTTDSLGNTYKTMPDGTSVLYRAAEVVEDEYTTDSLGNVYKTMPDGTSELFRAAEVVEDEFMTDSLGNVYKTMPDGSYELYRAAEVEDDGDAFPSTPPEVTPDETFVPEYFEDSLGNIYISTPDGEYDLYRAAEVEDDGDAFPETPSEPEYFEDSLGNVYVQGDSGEYELYRAAEVPEDIVEDDYDLFYTPPEDEYVYEPDDRYATEDDGDEYYDFKRGGLTTMMKKGGVAHMADGGYMLPEGAIDNGDGTYSIGNFTYDSVTDGYLYSIDPETGNISNVSPDAMYSSTPEDDYYSYDSLGNVFKNGEFYSSADSEDITSAGGGTRTPTIGNYLNPIVDSFRGLVGGGYDALTGALGTTAGAAGAGALIATLLGEDFSGDSGAQNQGLDMSKVGVINPRTTDFGIGPTNFVGYEDYGTGGGDYTPNEELLRNLNAPGYNPVREGDYGYEEVPAEAPKMASGGLSSMATPVSSYYTFGQPADILANLGMRAQPPQNPPQMMAQVGQQQPPQQAQQQGLPQQMPQQMAQQTPQGMPQQGMMPQQQGMPPPMRKGGLPHASNVPMVEGRMDFRRGSAVHGAGDGQSDDIPAMLADGEYVIDAETVAQIGNGSTKAGAQALDKFRESIRAHKRSAPINKIPPKTKALTSYLKGAR